MTALEDIAALLDDADTQIGTAQTLHDAALKTPSARAPLKSRIKNILENQRSVLDYLAVAITKEFGAPKGLVYYPLAQTPAEFPGEMKSKMPGVAAAAPHIATAIERHQPFQPDHDWLRELNQLTREQKHNRLTTQLVREIYECRVIHKPTGAWVQWRGLRFEPGMIHSDVGGQFEFSPRPEAFKRGEDVMDVTTPNPYGTPLVFRVPIDPQTQRPIPSPELNVQRGPIHLWCFLSPHKPVIDSLRMFQFNVRDLVSDIAQSSNW